jgi:hypothetical protein
MHAKDITRLTSIKMIEELYKSFKVVSFQNGASLQRVVNRAIWLYVNDHDFRKKIDGTMDLYIASGSNF